MLFDNRSVKLPNSRGYEVLKATQAQELPHKRGALAPLFTTLNNQTQFEITYPVKEHTTKLTRRHATANKIIIFLF